MRILGLVLVGGLALTAPIAAQAGPLGSTMEPGAAGPAPGIVRVWDGNGPGWHPMPNGWNGDWRRVPGPSRQWNGGSVSRRWWPECSSRMVGLLSGAERPYLLGLGSFGRGF